MSNSDLPLSIALGVGHAAATGFRIFLPMLIVSVAAPTGHLSLDERFAWLATSSALITLSVAALLEILAYYVPAVDNVLERPGDARFPGRRNGHGSISFLEATIGPETAGRDVAVGNATPRRRCDDWLRA